MKLENGLLIFILLLSFQSFALQELQLKGISRVDPPQIIKDRIVINVEIVFKTAVPKEYWLYYDYTMKKLVIDFYDLQITAPALTIRGTDILSDPEVWNIESPMGLTGKRAQIRFSMKEGIHYEGALKSDTVLCLQLWRYLEPAINKKRMKSIIIIPSIVTLVAAAIASIIISTRN